MKNIHRLLSPSVLLTMALSTTAVHADDPFSGSELSTYLRNLGLYLGYDITTPPSSSANSASTLINLPAIQNPEQSLFETMLGAAPVNATSSSDMLFVPNSNSAYSSINSQANITFTTPPYNSPSQSGVAVSSMIDQQTYQQDPVSQAVFNILTTPDSSYCQNSDGSAWVQGCPLLNQTTPSLYDDQVVTNVIGKLPNPSDYFTAKYNQPIVGQLNSNTLISPLLYTVASDNTSSNNSPGNSGAPTPAGSSSAGLTATSQAQAAANFIRYVTGAVAPLALPKQQDYNRVFAAAITPAKDGSPSLQQMRAQSVLATYLANLRIYAAQSSVGISNLYYIFSKRMPQDTIGTGDGPGSTSSKSSQALSEFTMATWRLFNPDKSAKTTWLNQINQASSATVEKEMVTLLAEINYQLYLNRQQEERLLLTNTLLLLQNARSSQPTASSLSASNANEPNN
jgi:intracellular multiplication protein IcmX